MKPIILLFILCLSQLGIAQKECTVKGIVKDAETQTPLAGATVSISCQECGDTAKSTKVSVMSDAKGAYEFKKFSCRKSCSSYTIKANKKDFLEGVQFSSKWNSSVVMDFSLFSTSVKAHKADPAPADANAGKPSAVSSSDPGKQAPKTDPSQADTNAHIDNTVQARMHPALILNDGTPILLENGTSALVMGQDTINRLDVEDMLQGRWIFTGKYAGDQSYDSNAYYMQGYFLENRKTGTWTRYYPNSKIKSALTCNMDQAAGAYELFYPDGAKHSKGFFTPATRQFKGIYEERYPSGHLHKKFEYDSLGRKNGLQYLYYPDAQMSVMAHMTNSVLDGQTLIFLKDGGVYAQREYDAGTLVKEVILSRDRKIEASVIDDLLKDLAGEHTDVIRELEAAVKEMDRISSRKQDFIRDRNKELALAARIISEQRKQLLIQQKHISRIELENKLQEDQLSRQRLFVIFGSLLTLILLFIIVFVVRTSREKTKINSILQQQKNEIEEKNREITDSLNYAKRLQQAILPSWESILRSFPRSFLLYKPKDIVAGDFYWMHTSRNAVFIAVADCTGHGVPGALVSIVCCNALNRTVNEFGLKETGKILDKVTELVLETFEKSGQGIRDGMDISLLCLDTASSSVQWSGANNPLWIVQGSELKEIKADKQPIGKSEKRVPFTTHNLSFTKGETYYLITDGYADQFGKEDKKLMKKKFRELILSVQDKTMEEQGQFLDEHHKAWKGSMEQTDDVTVMGIQF
ncbi:MAG TPA: SpoIIE family protein phosphatase [Bacteroidia bacterium]|nr:SpoIIE family protein phosphatase [Bacteroidia bacterium]